MGFLTYRNGPSMTSGLVPAVAWRSPRARLTLLQIWSASPVTQIPPASQPMASWRTASTLATSGVLTYARTGAPPNQMRERIAALIQGGGVPIFSLRCPSNYAWEQSTNNDLLRKLPSRAFVDA